MKGVRGVQWCACGVCCLRVLGLRTRLVHYVATQRCFNCADSTVVIVDMLVCVQGCCRRLFNGAAVVAASLGKKSTSVVVVPSRVLKLCKASTGATLGGV